MRGKDRRIDAEILIYGITPAHAGKRGGQIKFCGDNKDHPRPCGEKPNATSRDVKVMGSPPPMRGKDPA